jgi:hypothetical protein
MMKRKPDALFILAASVGIGVVATTTYDWMQSSDYIINKQAHNNVQSSEPAHGSQKGRFVNVSYTVNSGSPALVSGVPQLTTTPPLR